MILDASDDRHVADDGGSNAGQTPAPQVLSESPSAPVRVLAERTISERRLAANRANALKSTGPRTPEGKARVALNALTHGLSATTLLLPGEDPQELADIRDCFDLAHAPAGPVERVLVEQLISLTWKRRRLARAEGRLCESMARSRHSEWQQQVRQAIADGHDPKRDGPLPPEPAKHSDVATVLLDDIYGNQKLRDLGGWEKELTAQMTTISRQLVTWRRQRQQEEDAEARREERRDQRRSAGREASAESSAGAKH